VSDYITKPAIEEEIMARIGSAIQRKQQRQTLNAAKNAAEAATRAKSQFLTRMSHELRTPLTAILGFAELIQEHDDDTPLREEREGIDIIAHAGRHLLHVINDLLDLAAIEVHKLDIYPEHVDLATCLSDCLQTIAPLAQDRSITINDDLDGCRGLGVRADRQRLKQVLLNLLANAVKYNRPEGSIRIACERMPSNRIRLLVSDTGTGIAEEDMGSLFEPFSRLHKKYETDGTGIGLAISKDLVELMNGSIGVESVPGQGSTFWIELKQSEQPPRQDTGASDEPAVAAATEHPAKSATLLYIEDSPSHVRLMQRMLKDMGGIELITAHTPALGLELAFAHQPDAIVCDICLPGMNGYAVLEQLQADARTRHIPVIALSASAMPVQIEAGLRAGFRRYLTKPISVNGFKNALIELLEDEASLH
jgi:CheY-like chemotaxis protein